MNKNRLPFLKNSFLFSAAFIRLMRDTSEDEELNPKGSLPIPAVLGLNLDLDSMSFQFSSTTCWTHLFESDISFSAQIGYERDARIPDL